ncbi:MAG: polyprenyl synthetase family protein [Deltaproteobacteria bacterium]|uniref:Polyprenyl synthetase family protein n=1 Tax=Candidatus Zymogenus saltonus TaxID=2844893 RepID=A0A9D8KDC3_9DELT|nr:polyprenyl synthetase family protein [Candidatus Zymogenus saltonus]
MTKPFALIQSELEEVEAEIRRNIYSEVNLIPEIVKHIMFSGGKRFRPALLILCSRLFKNENNRKSISLAGVIELVHTATLLHDDVVDSAELRRGVESANILWGNQTSILVGDFLISQAFSMMVEVGDLRILDIVSLTTKKMTEGEMFQIALENALNITEEQYLKLIHNKTAVLIASACRIGALLGGTEKSNEEKLAKFGEGVGMAFQIVDDVLDYSSDLKEVGKPVGNDLAEQKATLPLIFSLLKMSDGERDKTAEIFFADKKSEEDFSYIFGIVKQHGGIEYSMKKAKSFTESAKEELVDFPDSEEKQALFDLADYVIERRA